VYLQYLKNITIIFLLNTTSYLYLQTLSLSTKAQFDIVVIYILQSICCYIIPILQTTRDTCYLILFILVKCSTCFGVLFVHHQELKTAYTATVYVKQLLLPAALGDEIEQSVQLKCWKERTESTVQITTLRLIFFKRIYDNLFTNSQKTQSFST
jgi:hypothetical protein